MNQFTFEARHRLTLGIFMGIGLLCLLLSFFFDGSPLHSRFWSNYLHNTVFFLGIGFVSTFIIAAFTTAYAGWHTVMKRVWESFSLFMIPGLILMLVVILGVWAGFHHLYHWADAAAVAEDRLLEHKSGFLNKWWYTFGTLIIVGAWIFFAQRFRALSLEQDANPENRLASYRRLKVWAAAFLPIGGFTSAAMIWQWIMSVDAHWYSTLFAWYTTASWFVACIALTIMLLIWLKSKGYYSEVSMEHFHDLGKYMFAFSIFWTYLWFSQYMLIWYGNIGEETIYYRTRLNDYRVMFFGNLILNFVLPFLILLRNDTKRKFGTLFFVSLLVFFGHWWNFFLMIKPGVLHTALEAAAHMGGAAEHGAEAAAHGATGLVNREAHGFLMGFTIPGLLEIGTMLGFLAGFLYYVLGRLSTAPLEPVNDPFIEESVHHHV